MIILSMAAGGLFAKSLQVSLEEDFKNGEISYSQKLAYQGYWILAPEKLPQRYRRLGSVPAKCGTEILMELRQNLHKMDAADQAFFQSLFLRPVFPATTYISPKGYFKLHYATSGVNAVPAGDENGNSIPDWIEEAGKIFDRCYEFEIDTLGYRKPPVDNPNDPQIDVYIHNINAYGFTTPDSQFVDNDRNVSSYIELDNDFKGRGFATHGLDALKVTAAHELFHVIQLGYIVRSKDFYFYEMSSVWMEDQAYNSINDYYANLPDFFNNTNLPLTTYNGAYEYGATVWLHFLSQRYGRNIVRDIWSDMPNENSLKAMNRAIVADGSNFSTEFGTFAIWNYFTGERADTTRYYDEGNHYPEIYVSQVIPFASDTSVSGSTTFLTSHYCKFIPQEPQTYHLNQSYNEPAQWVSEAIVSKDNRYSTFLFHPDDGGDIGYVPALSEIIAIASNTQCPDKYDYASSLQKKRDFTLRIVPGKGNLIYTNSIKKIYPNPFVVGRDHYLSVEFNVVKKSYVDFSILSENGRTVFRRSLGRVARGFHFRTIAWNGESSSGSLLPSGVYLAVISGGGVFMLTKIAVVR
ncbi:MAG: hypothetical protein GXO76_05915 [Calditrichaeota bacterium]|nr:hypothetical protein [Calditrichota bacterium]